MRWLNRLRQKKHVTDSDKFRARKRNQYKKNLERMKYAIDKGDIKTISLVTRYLENNGLRAPDNRSDCDKLIKMLNDVE